MSGKRYIKLTNYNSGKFLLKNSIDLQREIVYLKKSSYEIEKYAFDFGRFQENPPTNTSLWSLFVRLLKYAFRSFLGNAQDSSGIHWKECDSDPILEVKIKLEKLYKQYSNDYSPDTIKSIVESWRELKSLINAKLHKTQIRLRNNRKSIINPPSLDFRILIHRFISPHYTSASASNDEDVSVNERTTAISLFHLQNLALCLTKRTYLIRSMNSFHPAMIT